MTAEDNELHNLESLVEELLKPRPRTQKIDQCMKKAGLSTSGDPIERIDRVLQALNFQEPYKEIKE